MFLLLVGVVASAQTYWFKNIGLGEGLSSSHVNCVFKDSKGFVWIGTTSGLDRFDGVNLCQFQSNYAQPTALPDSYILSIQEAHDGMLWIKTNGGYVIMDPDAQLFDRSASQRLSIVAANLDPELVFFDNRKNLWVYDQGKAVYYYKAKQQLVYQLDFGDARTGLRQGDITGFCNTLEGVLVAYSNGCVSCINGEQQRVLWTNDVVAKNSSSEDDYQVFGDTLGNIWLYGDAHTYIYDKANKLWHRSLVEFAQTHGYQGVLDNDIVTGVSQDKMGHIWIATQRSGLLLFDAHSQTIMRHIVAGGLRGLPTNSLAGVYVDDTNLLWIATDNAGVSYFAPYLYMFDIDSNIGNVLGISEDKSGGLWFATRDHGLVYKNPTDGSLASFNKSNGLNDNMLSCVLAASDGTIWAGSNRFGLNRFTNRGIITYAYQPESKLGLLDNNIQALAEDRFGNVWIATSKEGLQCLNIKTGKFSNFNVQNGKLMSNNVTCLSASGSQLVAGTMNGIMIVNLSSNKVVNYTGTSSGDKHFTNNVITQVYLDSRGLVWVGTRDGLNMLDPTMDQLVSFTTTDGLPSNVICGIAEDKNHDIWVTTGRGTSRIALQNTSTEQSRFAYNFFGYNVNDGLQGVEFNMGAILATRSGNIYMGGQNGVNWLRHLNFKARQRPLHTLFSGLTIDDQPIQVGERYDGRIILQQTLNSLSSIRIGSSAKSICIALSVDDYNHAEHPRFIYQLVGKSDAWLPVTGDGYTLKLKDLSSGTYTLHVKAMLDDGMTVSDEQVMEIIIEKHWWQRWWSHLLGTMLLALLAYGVYRIVPHIRRFYLERRKEIDILKMRQERIDTLSQELRSGVVNMIPQLGLLQMETENPEHKETLNGLYHSAREMLANLKQLDESQNIIVSDNGFETSFDNGLVSDTPKTSELLVGDEGAVDTVPADESQFLVNDDGIISVGGKPVDTPSLKYLIYIVDQDADMLEFVQDCLKSTYRISTFTTVSDCQNAMLQNRPHLVMCAENMPQTTGSAFCEQIKNERSLERVPFILTTEGVLTQAELVMQNITLMADDYIPSPYNLQSVIARINALIGAPVDNDLVEDDTWRGSVAMCQAVRNQLQLTFDQYIKQNIARKDLSVEEMSKVMGISRTMTFRKIESVTGMPPSEYIRNVRLEEAAKLLESGYISPAEVSQELGFGNLASFSSFFQDKYGILPSQYAEGMRTKR